MNAAGLPLLLAYAAYPLAAHAQRMAGMAVMRNWIDAAWAVLAFAAILTLLAKRTLPGTRARLFLVCSLLALSSLFAVVRFGPQLADGVALVPWLMELKPLYYLGVSLLWFAAFGPPRPEIFIGFGVLLAGLMLIEFAVASIAAGRPMRPAGSGEINYDACLMLISLVMGLYAAKLPHTALIAIFGGLAVTFSRTSLIAAAVVFILAPGRSLVFKSAFASLSVAFMLLSFTVRELPMDAVEQLDRLVMWRAGVGLLMDHPWRALVGFAPGAPLPVDVPGGLKALWTQQQSAWNLSGVFAFNFHSLWLRGAVTWGLAAQGALLALVARCACQGRNAPVRGLALLALPMGMTMGLVYLSNVAVPLFLACLCAAAPRPQERRP